MKKFVLSLGLAILAGIGSINLPAADAPAAPASTNAPPADATKKADPDLAQRVADLEAYVGNGARGSDAADAKISSKLDGTPGPGHNAWQMASAALVLFMTLPGLALFYGGLVRRKNVLSVCAQCFFITGLVTILWWICGYSLVFGKGNMLGGLWGSFDKVFLKGVTSAPNGDYSYWVSENVYAIYQL